MSSFISLKFAWQNVMPFMGLGTMSMTRRKAAALVKIRAIPRKGETGGSSGWSTILTPNLSAMGMTSLTK
jgi:hypothetical protein